MAIQSLTSTPSPSASPTDLSSRDGSTTPLIPAFLIAGILLAIIATMFGWRRVLRNRTLGVVDFDMDGGVGLPAMNLTGPGHQHHQHVVRTSSTSAIPTTTAAGEVVFRLGRRYGVFRVPVHPTTTTETEFVVSVFGDGKDEDVVRPKPVLWDVWIQPTTKRASSSRRTRAQERRIVDVVDGIGECGGDGGGDNTRLGCSNSTSSKWSNVLVSPPPLLLYPHTRTCTRHNSEL